MAYYMGEDDPRDDEEFPALPTDADLEAFEKEAIPRSEVDYGYTSGYKAEEGEDEEEDRYPESGGVQFDTQTPGEFYSKIRPAAAPAPGKQVKFNFTPWNEEEYKAEKVDAPKEISFQPWTAEDYGAAGEKPPAPEGEEPDPLKVLDERGAKQAAARKDQTIGDLLESTALTPLETGHAILAPLGKMGAQGYFGLKGLLKYATGGGNAEAAKKVIEEGDKWVQENLGPVLDREYKSAPAQAVQEAFERPLAYLEKVAKPAADWSYERTKDPAVAAGVYSFIMMLPFLLGRRTSAIADLQKKVRSGKPLEAKDIQAFEREATDILTKQYGKDVMRQSRAAGVESLSQELNLAAKDRATQAEVADAASRPIATEVGFEGMEDYAPPIDPIADYAKKNKLAENVLREARTIYDAGLEKGLTPDEAREKVREELKIRKSKRGRYADAIQDLLQNEAAADEGYDWAGMAGRQDIRQQMPMRGWEDLLRGEEGQEPRTLHPIGREMGESAADTRLRTEPDLQTKTGEKVFEGDTSRIGGEGIYLGEEPLGIVDDAFAYAEGEALDLRPKKYGPMGEPIGDETRLPNMRSKYVANGVDLLRQMPERVADVIGEMLGQDVEYQFKWTDYLRDRAQALGINETIMPGLRKIIDIANGKLESEVAKLRRLGLAERLGEAETKILTEQGKLGEPTKPTITKAMAKTLREVDEEIAKFVARGLEVGKADITIEERIGAWLKGRLFDERGSVGSEIGPRNPQMNTLLSALMKNKTFRSFFGDSKATYANGQPRPMFHATTAKKGIDKFSKARAGENTGHPSAYFGHFFSVDPEVAELFVQKYLPQYDYMFFEKGAQIVPAWLRIENPKIYRAEQFLREFVMDPQTGRRALYSPEDIMAIKKELQRQGFDGLYIKGDKNMGRLLGGDEWVADTWVAFEGEQIKSLFNRGKFDKKSPFILDMMGFQQIYENAMRIVRSNDMANFGEIQDRVLSQLGYKKKDWEKVKEKMADRMATYFTDVLPPVEELIAGSIAGRGARDWYDRTKKAISSVFGSEDGKIYAGLLASTSPNNAVSKNFQQASEMFVRYLKNKERIPSMTEAELVELFSGIGMGEYAKNAARAVQGKRLGAVTVGGVKSSAFKINAFWNNLYNEMGMATLDIWMSRLAGIIQITPGLGFREVYNPQQYMLYQEKIRMTAKALGWTPKQVQSALWSFAKQMWSVMGPEKRRALFGPEEALIRLTHEDIAAVPDFTRSLLEDFDNGGPIFQALSEKGLDRSVFENLQRVRSIAEKEGLAGQVIAGADEGSIAVLSNLTRRLAAVRNAADLIRELKADRNARQKDLPKGITMGSINELDTMSWKQALDASETPAQAAFEADIRTINKFYGIKSRVYRAIGDTREWGTENSALQELTNVKDWGTVEYLASLQGIYGNQKNTVAFLMDKKGADRLYVYDMPRGVTLDQLRSAMDTLGLDYRTFIKMPDVVETVRVVMLDKGGENRAAARALGRQFDVDAEIYRGRGEFLGDPDFSSREVAQKNYWASVNRYERGGLSAGRLGKAPSYAIENIRKRGDFLEQSDLFGGEGKDGPPNSSTTLNFMGLQSLYEQMFGDADLRQLFTKAMRPLMNERGAIDLGALQKADRDTPVGSFVRWMKDNKRIVDDYMKGSHVLPDRVVPMIPKEKPLKPEKDIGAWSRALSPSKALGRAFTLKDHPVIDAFESMMSYATNLRNMREFSKDVLGEFKDSKDAVIKEIKPLFEANKGLLDRYGEIMDGIRDVEARIRKLPEKGSEQVRSLRQEKAVLWKAARAMEPDFKKMSEEHTAITTKLAKDHADVRIYLSAASELPPGISLTVPEAKAAESLRKYMEGTKDKLQELGIPVIKEKAYMPHLWKELLTEDLNSYRAFMSFKGTPNILRYMSRLPQSKSWIPSAHAAMEAYVPTAEYKIAMQPLMNRWNTTIETMQHPNLRRYMTDWRDANMYAKAESIADKVINGWVGFEYLRLIGLSTSVAFKHLLKLPNTWAEYGFTAGAKGTMKSAKTQTEALLDHFGLVKNKSNELRAFRAYVNQQALIRTMDEIPNMNKWQSTIKSILGQPVMAVEAFDNGVSVFAGMIRGMNKGVKYDTIQRKIWETIFDANFRSAWDQPLWQKSPGTRAATMFQMTPWKLFEFKMKLIEGAVRGDRDAFGESGTAKLVRYAMIVGAAETIARANNTSILEMFLHLPFMRDVFEADPDSPTGYRWGEPKPAVSPTIGLAYEVGKKGFEKGAEAHFRDFGVITKVQKASEGTFSDIYESPEKYMAGLRRVESHEDKEERIKRARSKKAKETRLRKATEKSKGSLF